jgi:cytochrome P450
MLKKNNRAQEEVDRVLGAKTEITYQDIVDLKYCACIFKEALRLWGPVPDFSRVSNEPMEILGYTIPENSWLFVSQYMNARTESFFPDPLEFKPERFLKSQDSTQAK